MLKKPVTERAHAGVLVGASSSPAMIVCASKEGPDLGAVIKKAASRALPSGAAGGAAMGLNILCLMWMRTTINYQYRCVRPFSSSLRVSGRPPRCNP